MEYHAFGIISEGVKSDCHYLICGVQGDFTKGLVMDPPKTIWTRELKFGKFRHRPDPLPETRHSTEQMCIPNKNIHTRVFL